jgi:predicted aspartyl protease
MAVNPHFLSEMGVTPTLQLRDDLDFPHSGIFKALHLAVKGTYVIKESATDFDITQAASGGFTQLQVKGGAAFRQGAYVQIGSGSGTTTNITMNTAYDPGTGGVDVTPVSSDVYLLMVATEANAIVLRGSNAVTNKLPEWIDSDIPIAVVKVAASSADSATDRPIQYLTTDQDDSSLSIGYASSNNYVEAMSISSSASGDVTIESKVSDKDIIFKVNDGGSSVNALTIDASQGGFSYNKKQDLTNDLATGWWTIALVEGRSGGSVSGGTGSASGDQRAYSRFLIKDESSSRHQLIVFDAMHLFGSNNYINVYNTGDFSTEVINAIRIKDASTYDGALLQINIADATNNIQVYIEDNYANKGWQLIQAVADNTDPSTVQSIGIKYSTAYGSWTVADTVTLSDGILEGGARFSNLQVEEIHNANDVAISIGSAGVIFNEDGHATNDFRVESDSYDSILLVDSGDDSISLGGDDAAKIGFYDANPIVPPVLDIATMIAGSPTPSVAELEAKVVLIANALVDLGLCNIA